MTEATATTADLPSSKVEPGAAENQAPKPRPKRPPRPNYAKIHANPLPLATHPLPAFIPQNPLSALRIAYLLIRDFFLPPTSHLPEPYIGYFSSETRSVHITDLNHVRALWEMGFFGKGTLSRSEPSWAERERARRKAGAEGGTSEEVTRKRREERRAFKLERARLEREKIEEQLREERRLAREQAAKAQSETRLGENVQANDADSGLEHVFPWQSQSSEDVAKENGHLVSPQQAPEPANVTSPPDIYEKPHLDPATKPSVATQEPTAEDGDKTIEQAEPGIDVNQEHLQLTLEEAFFLSYGLGVLAIHPSLSPYPDLTPSPTSPISTPNFFTLCRTHSNFPPAAISALQPDDPFLLHYAVYHHYRSLGWVVRPGIKFSVDYLLYNRGPVFSHAEFAVMIVPEYSAQSAKEGVKDWWWLHCINRVQSQVRKSLVVCYVEVPDSLDDVAAGDVGAVFKKYRIREFVIRRWLANRSRD